MKNLFSFKLYLQGLRKVRTTGFAMSVVLVVLNAWIPLQNISGVSAQLRELDTVAFAPFGFVLLLFAPLLVYNMFSYLNERKSSDFFHSLPQKRICVYISFMSAIVTWIASALLVSTLVNSMLWLLAESYTVTSRAVLLTFFGFLILAIVAAGFMALAMMLTGTAVANWLVFLLFSLFVRVCGYYFLSGLKEVCGMFHTAHSLLAIFEIEFFLPLTLLYDWLEPKSLSINIGWSLFYWSAVAIVLLALSAVAYSRRRSESATKSAPNSLMQHIYRIGVAFPFVGCGVYLLVTVRYSSRYFYMALLCILVGFLVWSIFELLTTKKIKNLIRALPLFLIPVMISAAGIGLIHAARGICIATVPEREEIVSVKSVLPERRTDDWIYDIVGSTEVKDPEIIDRVYEALAYTVEAQKDKIYRGGTYTVTMTLRSGRRVTYSLLAEFSLYKLFESSAEVQNRVWDIHQGGITGISCELISSEKCLKVWDVLKEEFASMDEETRTKYLGVSSIELTDFYIRIYGNVNGKNSYLLDSRYTPRALALYLQYYEEEYAALERLQTAKEEILKLRAQDVRYASMQIENCTIGMLDKLRCEDFGKITEFLNDLEADSHLTDYENAENVYRLSVSVILNGGSTNLFDEKLYFSLTKEDVERFRQIMNDRAGPVTE